jgi:flagellar motor component MotA
MSTIEALVPIQERLMIINNTLKSAVMDLLHFIFSFMLTFVCFAVMGCVMFGFKMKEFKDVQSAFHTLFRYSLAEESFSCSPPHFISIVPYRHSI